MDAPGAASRTVRVVRVHGPDSPPLPELVEALRAALDGTGPALLPVADDTTADAVVASAHLDRPVDDTTALLLPTTGSTGAPKVVELSGGSLLAGARATHARIGPPGRWLLALPLTHVAGWQVLVRGLLADDPVDRVPRLVPTEGASTAAGLVAALRTASPAGAARYASLVPTQLVRALDDPEATVALGRLDAVLLGGAATPGSLHRRALDAGIRVVRTYGSTETCGGCIYDGAVLDGVQARLAEDGRLMLAGPVLASGYRGDDDLTRAAFRTADARRWYLTNDLATIDEQGLVEVTGRADDVLVTGGVNVSPAAVEACLSEHPLVQEVVVVGVPDRQWGQVVVAVARLHDPAGQTVGEQTADVPALLRAHVTAALGRHAAPRHLVVVDEIPTRGVGKPDRAATLIVAEQHLTDLHLTQQRLTQHDLPGRDAEPGR